MRLWGLLFLLCVTGYPAPAKKISNFWSIDVGGYMSNVKERLNAPTGYGSRVSTLTGFVRFRRGWHIGKNYSLEPSAGLLFPWRSSADSNSRAIVSHFDLDFGIPLFSIVRFKTGPGLEWGTILSSERTVTLDNGTSTSDFYVPKATVHYSLWTLKGGFEIYLSKRFTLLPELMVSNVMSSIRRRYNVALTVGIRL